MYPCLGQPDGDLRPLGFGQGGVALEPLKAQRGDLPKPGRARRGPWLQQRRHLGKSGQGEQESKEKAHGEVKKV
jgi:hypothetical protein